MILTGDDMPLIGPHHWKFRPDIMINCRVHGHFWYNIKQEHPYFSWLGVYPKTDKVQLDAHS